LPLLNGKGNGNYSAFKKYAFNYESSIIISQKDIGAYSQYLQMKFFKLFKKKSFFKDGLKYWPHILDYQLPFKCDSCPEYKTLCLNKNC